MHGYELKGDHDTLCRLPEQANAYSAIFDFVTLVVSERHLLRAIDVVPDWWGIRIARVGRDCLLFRDLQAARNKSFPRSNVSREVALAARGSGCPPGTSQYESRAL